MEEITEIDETNLQDEADIADMVADFLADYFAFPQSVVNFHLDYLEENEFIEPEVDYIQIKRFIDSAINHLKSADPELYTGLLFKLSMDVSALQEFYLKFKAENKVSSVVFIRDFLSNVGFYSKLADEAMLEEAKKNEAEGIANTTSNQLQSIPKPSTEEETKEYKALKRRNVDAIHNAATARERLVELRGEMNAFEKKAKVEFENQFHTYIKEFNDAFRGVINTKIYYLEKLLWEKAKASAGIKKFFKKAQIKGALETKTFINYYLRNIDIDKTRSGGWHKYLHDCLKLLD